MKNDEPNDPPWVAVRAGNLDLAYKIMTARIEREPNNAPHYANRSTCLLAMHRLEEALQDLRQVHELRPDWQNSLLGVCLWWLGRFADAVQMWRNVLKAEYRDAAGGVEPPALLLFAASRLNDPDLEREARQWLRKRWKPSLAKIWPGPIAGYLLDKMDEETFLTGQTFLNDILEARRLVKAHFWVGLQAFRRGDREGYVAHLREAIHDTLPEHRAVMLEDEYWLAKAELDLNAGTLTTESQHSGN